MFGSPLLIIDILVTVWVVLVFLGLFGFLPLLAHKQQSLPSLSSRLAGAFIRTVTIVTLGGWVWVKLGLFTWFTAVLLYILGLAVGWFYSQKWQCRQHLRNLGRRIAIATVDIFDLGVSRHQIWGWAALPWRWTKNPIHKRLSQLQWNFPQAMLAMVGAILVIGLSVLLRFEHPAIEFRFSHPDLYSQLLVTQQILARDLPHTSNVPVYPILGAFVSLVSGIHPVQVTDLLGAILGTILVMSVGYTIEKLTRNRSASLAATYSLGVYLFTWNGLISPRLPLSIQHWLGALQQNLDRGLIHQWAVGNLELGAIFVVLALGFSTHLFYPKQQQEAAINTICCILLVAIIAPNLLILVLCGGFGIIFSRSMALFTVSTAWVMLALLAAIPNGNLPWLSGLLSTLPIGLSLLVGMLFFAIANAARLVLANWSAAVCLTLFFAITINFSLPARANINYLEYDVSARKAVEINRLFPRYNWTISAPIEQLSQVYGRGWYIDLAQFVEKYRDRVDRSDFYFPIKTPLFVFAEKQPFGVDKPEIAVTYSVLADPTYRHYRSPGGRAHLAQATLDLCDRYRQHHPDSRIYYEDDRLKIYQFLPDPNLKT